MRSLALPFIASAAVLLAGGCATQTPARSAEAGSGAHRDPVDDYIKVVMEKHHVPGAAVVIVRDGKVEKMATYGTADLESDAKVGPETAFQLASATKIFTGTLLMILAQEGKISLDEPVSKYLPDAPEAWRAITLRHLAAHTSGLKDETEDQTDFAASAASRYDAAKKTPLAYPPGERSEYGLTDFVVLTNILEKVTGQRFEELLQSRVFGPLGFSCTRFEHATEEGPVRRADIIPRRATTYRFEDGAMRRAWFLYPVHAYAAGGAFSCVKDLARWAVAMDQGTLLTPKMQEAAGSAFKLNDGRAGGFGVAFAVGKLRGSPIFGHSGGGALADVLRVPDKKLSVIVLTNVQGLLPVLASMIASRYLPPLPALAEPGITDNEPALTAALRRVAEGVMTGALDADTFAPSAKETLLPALRAFGTPDNVLFPPLDRMILLEDHKDSEAHKRIYRVIYGKDVSARWTFTLDTAGKVVSLDYDVE